MQHLEVSGAVVLYIGRKVSKMYTALLFETSCRLIFWRKLADFRSNVLLPSSDKKKRRCLATRLHAATIFTVTAVRTYLHTEIRFINLLPGHVFST
jgi:hypothetical protein